MANWLKTSEHKELREPSGVNTAITFFTMGLGSFLPNDGDVVAHRVTKVDQDGNEYVGEGRTYDAAESAAIAVYQKS
jgi:hypothetical protein